MEEFSHNATKPLLVSIRIMLAGQASGR